MAKNPTPTDGAEAQAVAEVHPSVGVLLAKLDDIAARDPSPGVTGIAQALAEYFRTPD